MNVEKLIIWHAWTWRFRAEMQDVFPTPSREDSLSFAFTEVAEALDAQLRENTLYKRNRNDDTHSVERELTQCAMMLLTAVPETWRGWQSLDTHPGLMQWTVRNIAVRVARCLEVPSDYAYILQTVAAISTAVDLSETLPEEFDKIRAKYKSIGHGGAIANVYPTKAEGLVLADYADGAGVE